MSLTDTPADAGHAGVAARFAALGLVEAVVARGVPLDEALDHAGALAKLEPRDRAFAHALAAACVRSWGYLLAVVGRCLDRPDGHLPDRLRAVLALGAAQLLILEVPPHAAVGATVELVDGKLARLKGLANAVLRRIDRERKAIDASIDRARSSTPDFLWTGWVKAYGPETAARIAAANQREAPLDLTLKPGLDAAAWAGKLGATLLPTGSLRLARPGKVTELPGYDTGDWWVQDAAAALPARLLGAVAGARVLDLCAAPGGKTAQLAAAGAEVTAVDQARGRLDRLRENLERLHLRAETVTADVAAYRPAEPFPFVLLDAPCSATGTLRRNPDIALHRTADEIRSLGRVQAKLLGAAAALVAPGGTLVFCTCSIEPREGPDLVDAFLAASPDWRRVPVEAAEVPGLEDALTAAGDLRTLPCHLEALGGVDGFYAARLVRI
ncbi:RsmB/NOP family class I SAM-dependent RNA methyltransferase [Zavarzinia sp.]|uniref:RsmB/NOP family class I SAM-dependent RNA methyltransferase n=1 Tax=Zavarzinia sp. TaxID=2027920 RepID=UPI00356B09E5